MSPVKQIILGFTLVLALILGVSSMVIIDEGERGVVLRTGKVVDVVEPGLHFRVPIIDNIKKMEVRTQKIEAGATAASKDLQDVRTDLAVQYNLKPDRVGILYGDTGRDYQAKLIDPAIQDIVKSVTAKFTAEELITKRADVKDQITTRMVERLEANYIVVTNVDIVNFNFSNEFNRAIEEKVTAKERALKAENDLERVKFEQQQEIEKYKAQAEQTRLQNDALKTGSDFLELKRLEVEMEYAKKWDGKLPQQFVPGSAIPFIDVGRGQ